jgi:hypothetical protein
VVALLFGGGGSGGTAWAAGAAPALAVPEGAQSGLNLRSTTSGAEVSIDGDSVGQTPVSKVLGLPAGEHTIRVARPGFAPYIDVFRTKPGQVAKIDVELVPVAGVISLTSPTGAVRVFVDDKYIGDAPVESELTPGSHQVRVERGGFYPESFAVSAAEGSTAGAKPLPAQGAAAAQVVSEVVGVDDRRRRGGGGRHGDHRAGGAANPQGCLRQRRYVRHRPGQHPRRPDHVPTAASPGHPLLSRCAFEPLEQLGADSIDIGQAELAVQR